jgi:hypothetical protein
VETDTFVKSYIPVDTNSIIIPQFPPSNQTLHFSVYGSDFSNTAITLAKQVRTYHASQSSKSNNNTTSETKEVNEQSEINYVLDDILKSKFEDSFFDCVYDKGTFDSIAMVGRQFVDNVEEEDDMDEDYEHRYALEVQRILKQDGYFIIISCNHSEEELLTLFVEDTGFSLLWNLTECFTDLRVFVFQKKRNSHSTLTSHHSCTKI